MRKVLAGLVLLAMTSGLSGQSVLRVTGIIEDLFGEVPPSIFPGLLMDLTIWYDASEQPEYLSDIDFYWWPDAITDVRIELPGIEYAAQGGVGDVYSREDYLSFFAQPDATLDGYLFTDLQIDLTLGGVWDNGQDHVNLFFFANYWDGTAERISFSFNLVPIPEPSAAWLLLAGVCPLLLNHRRR